MPSTLELHTEVYGEVSSTTLNTYPVVDPDCQTSWMYTPLPVSAIVSTVVSAASVPAPLAASPCLMLSTPELM